MFIDAEGIEPVFERLMLRDVDRTGLDRADGGGGDRMGGSPLTDAEGFGPIAEPAARHRRVDSPRSSMTQALFETNVSTMSQITIVVSAHCRRDNVLTYMTPASPALAYYERTACSPQWLAFNHALALELSAGLPLEENRRLFARIGERVAQQLPLERCNTLAELESAVNARWETIGWGFSRLEEGAETLSITHECSPLAAAFGAEATGWTCGFLEGAYQTWFRAQGSPAGLRVQAISDGDEEAQATQVRLALGKFTA